MMEMDRGKLFIGGISWDTNEDRLKEYFGIYGEVVEAVIMRDRNTGRARGFGFVVFADPSVAERVVKEKHTIDGRTVEAKKAVPRDDHHLIINRNNNNSNNSSIQGSPGQVRSTKKIFVGGLASTVTDNDFKEYFAQFGAITDVVVMYDHYTQRPRGFGFITYESEDSVDRVLHKTFHELDGKMVEVKRAVPKESSPGPNRSPFVGYSYGFGRANNNFLNSYSQGYNSNLGSLGGYGGVRMDSRYNSPLTNRLSQYASPGYGMGLNVDQGLNHPFGGSSNLGGYGRVMSPFFGAGSQTRYNAPIGSRSDSLFDSSPWANNGGGLNTSGNSNSSSGGMYFGLGSGGGFGAFGNNGLNWGASSIDGNNNNNASYGAVGSVGYRAGGENISYAFGRNSVGPQPSSFSSSPGGYENVYPSGYGDPSWQMAASSERENPIGYGIGRSKESDEYDVDYDIPNRQSNRGMAS